MEQHQQASPRPSAAAEASFAAPVITRRQTIAEVLKIQPYCGKIGRKSLKEAIAGGFQLHKAIVKFECMMKDHCVSENAILSHELNSKLQSMKRERDDILRVDNTTMNNHTMHFFEQRLLEYVRYEMQKDDPAATTIPPPLPRELRLWINTQRSRKRKYEDGKFASQPQSLAACQEAIQVLNAIDFSWTNPLQVRKKSWEERYQILVEFHEQHGHCKVPQVHPELGTWIKEIRAHYETFRNGGKRSWLVSEERMDALNKLGFVWKVRWGRPKKGDERFRLRRKGEEESLVIEGNTAAVVVDTEQDDDNEAPAAATVASPTDQDTQDSDST